MKKISLIVALTLSTQILLTGCSFTSKQKDNSQQQSAKTTQSTNASTSDTSSNSTSTDTSDNKNASTPKDTNNSKASDAATSSTNISKKDIQTYSTMTKANLIKALGKNYKSQGSTLTFPNGLSFYGLSKDESKPTIIKCNNNVKIMGIQNGMTFSQVQSILGKTSIKESYLGTKTNKVYKIEYAYGKDLLKVISPKNDGKESFIEVHMQ